MVDNLTKQAIWFPAYALILSVAYVSGDFFHLTIRFQYSFSNAIMEQFRFSDKRALNAAASPSFIKYDSNHVEDLSWIPLLLHAIFKACKTHVIDMIPSDQTSALSFETINLMPP